jgi:hypothetical protein
MKNRQGMDAFSLLSDVLFEPSKGPTPSFGPRVTPHVPKVSPEKASDSADIVESGPSWRPAQ